MNNKCILGIDTSNYKTSVALTDRSGNIICDKRRFLMVKQGEKGLRQSDALFQHIKVLPDLIEEAMSLDAEIAAVSFSARPRPKEGSYMPVFLAGESLAKSLACALDVPLYEFSHQEGHIEAIKAFSEIKDKDSFLACHFSGGTSELLEVREKECGYSIDICGGSKDIAFGQVIDRTGVGLGHAFPAGEICDEIACSQPLNKRWDRLTKIKVREGWLNLSGIDTQMKRLIEAKDYDDALMGELFLRLAEAMEEMIVQGALKTGLTDVIMAGGVSSSRFIRNHMIKKLDSEGINLVFGDNDLSQDNGVGIALLGGKALWH